MPSSLGLLMLSPQHLVNTHFMLPPPQARAPFSFTGTPSCLSSIHSCPLLFMSILHQRDLSKPPERKGPLLTEVFQPCPLPLWIQPTVPRFAQSPLPALAHTCFQPSSCSRSPNHPASFHLLHCTLLSGRSKQEKLPHPPAPLPTSLIFML